MIVFRKWVPTYPLHKTIGSPTNSGWFKRASYPNDLQYNIGHQFGVVHLMLEITLSRQIQFMKYNISMTGLLCNNGDMLILFKGTLARLLNVLYIAMKWKQYSHITPTLVTKESSLQMASFCKTSPNYPWPCYATIHTTISPFRFFLTDRYGLDSDVRKSLYKSINDWLSAIGPSRRYMGGDKPNLADLVSTLPRDE